MNFANVFNNKLGYYRVHDPLNPSAYSSKAQALLHATTANAAVDWCFNDTVFSKTNWLNEPVESLPELYKQRAIQLRESYDYLILNYSGGSDSKTVLDTFLNNKIHLDEILVRWPRKGSAKTYNPNTENLTSENVVTEWDSVIVPDLQYIAQHYPQIKITVHDYTDDVIEWYKQDPIWITKVMGDHLGPAQVGRFNMGMDSHKRVLDRGRRVAHIFGVDKPKIAYQDGKFYSYFVDSVANLGGMIYDDSVDQHNIQEFFYWTPDFPKLLVKQAYAIAKFFKNNPSLLHIIPKGYVSLTSRTTYEILTKSIIYPTWDMSRFQANKPTSQFFPEFDEWFHDSFLGTSTFNSWHSGIGYLLKNVDQRFFYKNDNGRINGFTSCVSPYYALAI